MPESELIKEEHKDFGISTPTGYPNSNTVIKPITVIKINKNNPANNADNESLINATEVPKINTNEEKLEPKSNYTKKMQNLNNSRKEEKGSIEVSNSINISRNQRKSQELKCTAKTLENNQTTSTDVPKSQRDDIKSEQSTSKRYLSKSLEKNKETKAKHEIDGNLLNKPEHVYKKTKYDDYITAYKKEISDKRRMSSCNTESKQAVISNTLSNKTETTDVVHHIKCKKQKLENEADERNIITLDSHKSSTSVTPVVTKSSLPLNSTNIFGNYSNVINSEGIMKEDYKNEINNKNLECKNLESVGLNHKNDNEVQMKSMSISVLKFENEGSRKLGDENLNVKNTSVNEDRINSSLITSNTSLNQETLNTDSICQNNSNQTLLVRPVLRKRGRPRKILLTVQKTADISNKESQENLEVLQKMNDISTEETLVHSNRHSEQSYNFSNNDGIDDNSSTEGNILNSITIKKSDRP